MSLLSHLLSGNPPPKKLVKDFFVQIMALLDHPPTPPLPDPLTVHLLVANTTTAHRRPTLAVFTFAEPVSLTLVVEHLQRDSTARSVGITPQHLWLAGNRKRQLSDLIDTFLAELGIDLDDALLKPVCGEISDS
jgi:hypothetical protein